MAQHKVVLPCLYEHHPVIVDILLYFFRNIQHLMQRHRTVPRFFAVIDDYRNDRRKFIRPSHP